MAHFNAIFDEDSQDSEESLAGIDKWIVLASALVYYVLDDLELYLFVLPLRTLSSYQ